MADLPELRVDNPGGEWLQGYVDSARKTYLTAPEGSASRNLGSDGDAKVTGYWRDASNRLGIWNLSPDLLKDIPGAMGEENFRNDSEKLRRLQKTIKKSGYDPSQATILIQVREDGKPFIVEGNHRVAEGLLSGRSTIPVEIQYLRGGEVAEGLLSPERLRQANEPRPTDQSKLPAVIDAASVASQLARTQADDPRPKGLRRGLGSLKRAPWMALAQMTWENLTPKQREVAEQYGKDAYGSFEDAWKAASAWSERNRFPTGVEGGLQWAMDRLGFSDYEGEQPRPNTHEDLSLPELITGYTVAPAKTGSTRSDAVTREELVSRLRSNPELQKVSQKALKDLGYNKGTIPLFRVTLTPEGGFKSEGVVSTSLTPESHLDTIKYFTEGKISPFENITPRLIRYDVPIEKVIGYLPAFKEQIKRGVNKAVKAKGMGQRDLKGFSKVGDPARHAKNLLDKQKEVLVDVTGIPPTFMKVFDAQESTETFVDPRSIRMSRIEKIGRGRIKTPEDYRRDMGGNETYFDLEEAGKLLRDLGKDRFRQLENEQMQKEIEHYKKFFGKAAGGFVDKPLYEDARMIG